MGAGAGAGGGGGAFTWKIVVARTVRLDARNTTSWWRPGTTSVKVSRADPRRLRTWSSRYQNVWRPARAVPLRATCTVRVWPVWAPGCGERIRSLGGGGGGGACVVVLVVVLAAEATPAGGVLVEELPPHPLAASASASSPQTHRLFGLAAVNVLIMGIRWVCFRCEPSRRLRATRLLPIDAGRQDVLPATTRASAGYASTPLAASAGSIWGSRWFGSGVFSLGSAAGHGSGRWRCRQRWRRPGRCC
jgi:hypothetical protein